VLVGVELGEEVQFQVFFSQKVAAVAVAELYITQLFQWFLARCIQLA
jgi:hypothetical protein